MVPMLTCGLVRSNFAFATGVLLWTSWFVAAAACGATLTAPGVAASGLHLFLAGATGYSPVAFARLVLLGRPARSLTLTRRSPSRYRPLLDRPARSLTLTRRSPSR